MQTLRRRWFLILLAAALVVGIGWAKQLVSIAEIMPRNWIIASVLIAMALPLKIEAIWTTLRRPAPALLAVMMNQLVVPLLAWLASLMLKGDLALGVIIAAAVPCTLASAAVWTRLAGGNDAVSLLVTIITNMSCFLVTPALIYLFAGQANTSVRLIDMMIKLLVLIVLPILAAQWLRTLPKLGPWAMANKQGLNVYAQVGVLSIVFVGAVNCGLTIANLESRLAPIAGQIFLMLMLVAAVHLIALWFGFWMAGSLGMARAEQIAIAFAGSQKTLMVGLAIALPFGGLTVLPMLAYHVEQLLIDTVIADRFRNESLT